MFTRIAIYAVAFVFLTGIVFAAYKGWERQVKREAELELTIDQQRKALDQAAREAELQKAALDEARAIIDKNRAEEAELESRLADLQRLVDGAEDRPASDVIKKTIEELGK